MWVFVNLQVESTILCMFVSLNQIDIIVCNLLEIAFSSWKDKDKKTFWQFNDLLRNYLLVYLRKEKKKTKPHNIDFKSFWFSEFT